MIFSILVFLIKKRKNKNTLNCTNIKQFENLKFERKNMSKKNQMSFQLGGTPIIEEDENEENTAPVSVSGLNATPMKPKPKAK